MEKYPNVKNAHIVPRTYLANFADEERRIATRVKGDSKVRIRRIEKVGTRRRFYRRERPDGTSIDDIEFVLGLGESAATPILRSFAETWPLPQQSRAQLAELFAFQIVRGPRWKAWHADFTRKLAEEWRERESAKAPDDPTRISEEALSEFAEGRMAPTARFMQMFSLARKITTAIGSMHWTLVEFETPLIATSDHPMSMWPGDLRSRTPAATPLNAGILEALEYRLPISPHHLILMTWSDKPDNVDARVRGVRSHAANANAFTVADGDREWFYRPGTSPPVGSGRLLPLSRELVSGYDATAAYHSARRKAVSDYIQPLIGEDAEGNEITIFGITE